MPASANLDFWNYPAWLNDSRDNPRDPKFEPFWMRDCASEVVLVPSLPVRWTERQMMYGTNRISGNLVYMKTRPAPQTRTPNYPAIIRWLDRNGAVIEEVIADKGQAIEMPQDAVDYEFEADCNRDMFRLVG